jgi:hypothetical protein
MEEILISIGLFAVALFALIISIFAKAKLKEQGVPEPIAEEISDVIEEEIQEFGNDLLGGASTNTPRKKGRPRKSITTLVFILFALSFTSCTFLTDLVSTEASKFHISYDRLSPTEKPLDSLIIVSKPTYISFDDKEVLEGVDYTYTKLGGSFWFLKVNGKYRIEFTPNDTIIRIYKGK